MDKEDIHIIEVIVEDGEVIAMNVIGFPENEIDYPPEESERHVVSVSGKSIEAADRFLEEFDAEDIRD